MDDLNIQAGVTVNAEQAERAFTALGDKAQKMANEVTKAADKAGKATDGMGDGAEKGADKFTRAESRMRSAIQKSTRELEMLGKTASQKFEAQLEFKGLDKAKFRPFLDELRKTEEAAAKARDGVSGIGDAARVAGSMMAAAFSGAALLGVVGKVVSVQREFDVLNSSLKTVTGSSAAAEREMAWLKDFAKETPFGLAQATQGFVKMKALGLDPTRAALTSFGNTASAMGKDLNQMIEAVADASTGEFERLKEFGIKAKKEGDSVSLTFQGVTTTIKNNAAEITKYLENIGNTSFGGAMEERAKTLDGTIAALGDTWDELFRTVSTNNVGSLIFDSVTLANGVLEDATTILKAMGGAAQDAGKGTGALSTIQNGLATVFETVSVLGVNLKYTLVGIGNEIGGLAAQVVQAAQFNFAGVRAIREQMVADAEEARRQVDLTTERILSARKEQERYASYATRNASAATDPRRIDLGKPGGDSVAAPSKPTKAGLSDYDKLIQKLGQEIPKAAAEAEAAQMGYNKAQTEFLALAASPAWAKFTNDQRATVAALFENKIASEQSAEAAKTLAKANLDAAASREKYLTSLSTGLDKIEADIAAQIEATERMGLSKEAIAELDAAKLEMLATDLELQAIKAMDRNLDQQTYDALKKQAAAYRELGIAKKGGAAKEAALEMEKANAEAAKKAQEDWERAAEQINGSLTEALLRGFESGKDFAKNLRDTVVNMFKTMVLRPIISAVVNPVAGAITGALGLSGAANAATSGASTLGGIGNIASLGSNLFSSGLGSTISGAIGSGVGALFGTTAGNAALGTSLGLGAGSATAAAAAAAQAGGASAAAAASAASAGATIAAAIPYIGAAVAALALLTKKSTPHTGGIGAYSADAGAITGASVGLAFGIDQKHYTQAGEELSTSVAKGIVQILDSTATTFGKQAGYYAATAFADDSSKDGAWGALRIKFGEKVLLDWADTAMRDANVPREFADGEAGQKQYLAAVAADVRVALDSIGLPAWATGMLDKLGQGASIEQLAGAVDQINAQMVGVENLRVSFENIGLDKLAEMSFDAASGLAAAAGGFDALQGKLATYYDAFYTEEEKRANTIRQITRTLRDAGAQVTADDVGKATREQFRAIYESIVEVNGAADPVAVAMLNVAGAFASVTESVSRTSQQIERSARLQAERVADQKSRELKEQEYNRQLQAFESGGQDFDLLRQSLLKAGHAAALLGAITERAFASPTGKFSIGGVETSIPKVDAAFNAAAFNYEFGILQARIRREIANELSTNALQVEDIAQALVEVSNASFVSQYDAVTGPIFQAIKDTIVDAAGVGSDEAKNIISNAISGVALYSAVQQSAGYTARGPGIASVNAALAGAFAVKSAEDVRQYETAQVALNDALRGGKINSQEYNASIQALNETLPDAADLAFNLAAQNERAAGAYAGIGQVALESLRFYFGELQKLSGELAKTAEPVNLVVSAIGRLNSVAEVFGRSAAAGGSLSVDPAFAGEFNKGRLIAESAAIAASVLTTADAVRAAATIKASPAFAGEDARTIRDASLLIDGITQYNAIAFENAFTKISAALARSDITDDQYRTLFKTATDMFNGVPEETRTLIDSMTRLRDAMSGFADGLLIDEQRTTLTAGATLAEMQRQYAQAFAGASTGDNEAIGKYQQLATTLLDKDLYSTRAEYNAAFGSVYGDARQLEAIGVNTLANAQGSEMVSELKDMNAKLNKRVEDLEKNLLAALAQIAKNTSDTSRGIEQQIVMAEETP